MITLSLPAVEFSYVVVAVIVTLSFVEPNVTISVESYVMLAGWLTVFVPSYGFVISPVLLTEIFLISF